LVLFKGRGVTRFVLQRYVVWLGLKVIPELLVLRGELSHGRHLGAVLAIHGGVSHWGWREGLHQLGNWSINLVAGLTSTRHDESRACWLLHRWDFLLHLGIGGYLTKFHLLLLDRRLIRGVGWLGGLQSGDQFSFLLGFTFVRHAKFLL
jgi:hypothetical protein